MVMQRSQAFLEKQKGVLKQSSGLSPILQAGEDQNGD
jgi:hypothetical protein